MPHLIGLHAWPPGPPPAAPVALLPLPTRLPSLLEPRADHMQADPGCGDADGTALGGRRPMW